MSQSINSSDFSSNAKPKHPLLIHLLKRLWQLLLTATGLTIGILLLIGFNNYGVDSITTLFAATEKHAWYLSRAAGVIGYGLFWLSVLFGLLLSTRLGKSLTMTRVFALHKFLSFVAIGFSLFHAGVLLADHFLNISVWQLLIPFSFTTDSLGVAMGQIGFYLLFICAISFYVKQYIGQSAWRWIHFSAFLAYMLISIHLAMIGSDTSELPLLIFYAVTQTIIFLLIGYRLIGLNLK